MPTLLLAGPVLRRVTPTSVSVWVATSQSCGVRLDVYGSTASLNRPAGAQAGTVSATSVGTGARDTVRVGGALHIAVVTAPIAGVPPDTICSYNVTLDVRDEAAAGHGFTGQWDLGGLKLLDLGDPGDDYQGGLGYAEGRLPSFASPPADISGLRLLHGSCFKLHGDGPSIFPNIDDIIGDALAADATPQKKRPHLLMLTGDQIYADEVATALLPSLTSLGANLLAASSPETVPVPGSSAGDVPVTQASFPAGRRQKLIRVTGGMSSNEAHNHLLGFGEWAALYLLSWTGPLKERMVEGTKPLWPATLAVLPDDHLGVKDLTGVPIALDPAAAPGPAEALLTSLFTPAGAGQLAELRAEFAAQRSDVAKVGEDGEKVRRALANVSVLSICDDHEVSDDWFITGAWRSRVLASTLGRTMVRNALLAYVLFQGWGNTPERFATAGTPEAQLLALVPSLFAGSGSVPDPAVAGQVDHLLGLDDPTGGGSAERVAFNYHVDLAGARLVVLDTRTHREYGTPNGPPGLLSDAALDEQLPISLTDDVPLLILVSPAPVLGPRLIEEILAPAVTRAYDLYHMALRNAAEAAAVGMDTRKPFGDLFLDVESWSARPAAFERFLDRVTRCPQVVILAGDVHYAASYVMDYQRFEVPTDQGGVPSADPRPHSPSARIVHFTSSAIRNAWMPAVATFARSIGIAEHLEQIGFEGSRLGWTRATPPVMTEGDPAAGEAHPLRARLRREPVVLPTLGWKASHPVRPPEWAYRVTPLSDTRTDDLRFHDLGAAGPTQVLGPDVPDAPVPPTDGATSERWVEPNGAYEVATALHAANVDGGAVTRTLVFANNIGAVTFSRESPDAPLAVQMAIHFVRAHPASDDEKPQAYVVHAASLAASPLPAADHVGGRLTVSDPGPAHDATQDILQSLSTWLGSVLNDILRVLADAEGGQLLLAEHGWEGGAPVLPASLLGRLDEQAQAGSDPSVAKAESFAEVLVALTALGDAVVAASGPGATGVSGLELVADLLDVSMSMRVREDHPALWAVLRLLELASDDGAQLANLGDLVGDTQRYLAGLVSGPGYAQTFQDYSAAILGGIGVGLAFLPSVGTHGHDKTSLRSEVLYGWAPAGPEDHPHLAPLLARTLTWRLDGQVASTPSTPAVEEILDLTVVLVPAEHNHGSWGVFLRLSGATAITIPFGRKTADHDATGWQLTIASTDGVALELLLATNGFIRGAGSGYKASIALERPDDINGSWVWGSATGSHLEIQHARVAVTLADDDKGWLLDLSAHADHVIVDIELGSDSFLRAVLPPSLRIDTVLGLGVNKRRGVYLDGGVALVVDLPVHLTLGSAQVLALVVQGLHLRIGIAAADAATGRGGSLTTGLTMDASVQVAGGVFTATVAGVGMAFSLEQVAASPARDTGTAGRWKPQLSAVPPNGLGIVVKAGPVSGGGYIGYDANRGEYTGALQLHVSLSAISVDISALGMLDTKIPEHEDDWALLIILAATFQPGIQLGLGITLSGLGGVLGVNHTLDSDAIAAGLRTKSLDAILFPPDPVAQAPHIFAVWRQTMPIAVDRTVVGPMIQLGWGGASDICQLELAVLIELDPNPVQIVLLGSFRFTAPTQSVGLVRLRADVFGRLRFDPLDFLLEAALVDSKLGTFAISGGLVMVARGGPDAAFVLSVGGFNPHFTPPANVPVPDRIRVDISGSSNPRLRLEAYLAVTSQSFQFGARAELHAAAGPLALDGWLGLDALVAWLPHFRFSVEISAGLSLSYDGSPVLEVSIDVLLEGPGPWHVHGYASLTLLFITLSLPIDASWGDSSGPTAPTAQPLTLVREALSAPDAWSACPPSAASSVVVLRPPAGTVIPAHPLAAISCRQRVVPLGLTVTHVGNQPLDKPTTVDVTGLLLAGSPAGETTPAVEAFAAGQFLDLTDDQRLSRPSFEPMRAGLATGGQSLDAGNATVVATSYKTIALDGATRTRRPLWLLDLAHADAVLRPAAPATPRPLPPLFATVPDTLRTIAGAAGASEAANPVSETASLAAQRAGAATLLDAVGVAGGAR